MVQASRKFKNLQKGLEYKFLYHDDPTSMYLLLALLENELKVKRLKPKYICMESIRRSLGRVLNHREDKEELKATIYRLINNDINRLELALYLESYSLGYKNNTWANQLETAAIKTIPIEHLYNRESLFHTALNNEALVVKNRLYASLDADQESNKYIKKITYVYCERMIKGKIFSLNDSLNRQLTFDLESDDLRIKQEKDIPIRELSKIYRRIYMSYVKSMYRIYKDAYWFGVNDKVISRY